MDVVPAIVAGDGVSVALPPFVVGVYELIAASDGCPLGVNVDGDGGGGVAGVAVDLVGDGDELLLLVVVVDWWWWLLLLFVDFVH